MFTSSVCEDAEVDPRPDRLGRAEQDVLEVGRDHRAAPAVGQGAADAGQDEAAVVGVHAHVGPVHDLDDLAVDAPWGDVELAPVLPLPGRRATDERQLAFLLAELG